MSSPLNITTSDSLPFGAWLCEWDLAAGENPKIVLAADMGQPPAVFYDDVGSACVVFGYLSSAHEVSSWGNSLEAACAVDQTGRFGGMPAIDSLRGSFVVIHWHNPTGSLTAVRDALGLHPCFYAWNRQALYVGSSPQVVQRCVAPSPQFNLPLIAEHIQHLSSEAQRIDTFFHGVNRLPAAHLLQIDSTAMRGPLSVQRYWDPLPKNFEWATGDDVQRFPTLLTTAVERSLALGANSISLSGGFDSVGVAALAYELKPIGLDLHAISLRFPPPHDEGATQQAVAAALGMSQTLSTFQESLGGRDPMTVTIEFAHHSPGPPLSIFQAMYAGVVRQAAAAGHNRILLGTGGDDFLDVDLTYAYDALKGFQLGALWRYYRACERTSPFGRRRIARLVLWQNALRPLLATSALGAGVRRVRRGSPAPASFYPWMAANPTLMQQVTARRLARSERIADDSHGDSRYVAAMRDLPQSSLLAQEMEQAFTWFQQAGAVAYYPYFDRDLVELCLRIPPSALIEGGYFKGPLRQLVAQKLPSVSFSRKKVDFTATMLDYVRRVAATRWETFGGISLLAELGVIDKAQADIFLDDYVAGAHGDWLRSWLIMTTELWLRTQINA